MSKLGYRLQKALDNLQMTQQELAHKCDNPYITQSYISNIITGRSRNPRRLKEIARVLKVEEGWLLYGIVDKKSPPPLKLDGLKRELEKLLDHVQHINDLVQYLDV